MNKVISVQALEEMGGVLNASLVAKAVKWTKRVDDGEDIDYDMNVFVRKLAYADQEQILSMIGFFDMPVPAKPIKDIDPDEDEVTKPVEPVPAKRKPVMNAALIASALRLGEKGEESLTYEQACNLEPSLAIEFIRVIDEVNPPPKKKVNPPRRDVAPAGAERGGGQDYQGSQGNAFD